MDYTQDGEEVPEEAKSKFKKMLIVGVVIVVFAGILFIVHWLVNIDLILYIWPVILAAVSVIAVFRRL